MDTRYLNLNICILRLSAIGDVCNTISTVQLIQKYYPNSNITWIVGKTESAILQPLNKINLIIYNKRGGIQELFRLWKTLRSYNFDVLLNMQTAFRASIVSLGIKAKEKVGFEKTRSRELQWLFVNKNTNRPLKPNVVDSFIEFARYLGIQSNDLKWQYPITSENIKKVNPFLVKNKLNIIISPCSSKKEKYWTVEGYIAVARYLKQHDCNVILTGSNASDEVLFTNQICQTVLNLTNAVGKTSLPELITLISQVDLVITPDSAAIHMANMVDTKIVGLYAYYSPLNTGPYNQIENVISVYEENIQKQYKKSSDQLPWFTKAKGDNLMKQITVEQVINKISSLLNI